MTSAILEACVDTHFYRQGSDVCVRGPDWQFRCLYLFEPLKNHCHFIVYPPTLLHVYFGCLIAIHNLMPVIL